MVKAQCRTSLPVFYIQLHRLLSSRSEVTPHENPMKSIYKILTNKLLDPPHVLIMKEEKAVTMVMAIGLCCIGWDTNAM